MDNKPLAEVLRPKNITEIVGQQHLLKLGSPLRAAIDKGMVGSMILWGPPGVGKTTLARVIASSITSELVSFSAVFAGVKEVKEAAQRALTAKAGAPKLVLFVDEFHRFNKAQQDVFLPYVEAGVFVFIGATTENPSFEVNRALLSRVQVYILKSLTASDLALLFDKAAANFSELSFDLEVKQTLIDFAAGDARRLYNSLESTVNAAKAGGVTKIDPAFLSELLSAGIKHFDKRRDQFYEQISVLHKAVRGSDPDAALYWLSRMLISGTDPLYLARRILRMAWEDVGLANPKAAHICLDAYQTCERLGSPEGELSLAAAVIYLAVSAKSNSVYSAFNSAQQCVQNNPDYPVPLRFRNAANRFLKNLGYGKDYLYPHDFKEAYVAKEHYFPDEMPQQNFYIPGSNGLEPKIARKLARLKALADNSAKKVKKNTDPRS